MDRVDPTVDPWGSWSMAPGWIFLTLCLFTPSISPVFLLHPSLQLGEVGGRAPKSWDSDYSCSELKPPPTGDATYGKRTASVPVFPYLGSGGVGVRGEENTNLPGSCAGEIISDAVGFLFHFLK